MAVFLGIDVSTTASKSLWIDENGVVLATAPHTHTLQTPRPFWSEQDPLERWQAVSASIRATLGKAGIGGEAVSAVGLTGQMHGLVLPWEHMKSRVGGEKECERRRRRLSSVSESTGSASGIRRWSPSITEVSPTAISGFPAEG